MAFRTKNRKAERGEVELLRGLIKLANQLQSSLTLDAIVHVIATALSETFGFREASVYLREADGDFAVHATVGEFPEFDRLLFERPVPQAHLGRSSSSRSTRSARPSSSITAATSGPRSSSTTCRELDLGQRRSDEWSSNDDLFVPLYDKDHELMGVLDLFDPADRQLPTLELVKSLEVFATHAAVAIENARQYEALEETTAQLQAQLALRHAHPRAQRRAPRDARAARGLRAHRDAAQGDRRLRRPGGPPRRRGEPASCTAATPPTRTIEQMQSWRSPPTWVSAAGSCATTRRSSSTTCSTTRAARSCPARSGSRRRASSRRSTLGDTVIGVLAIDRMGERTFDERELEPVTLFANLAAIAIHNARQYEEAEKASKQLEEQLALSHELLSASGAVLSSLEQTEVLEHIADTLKQIVDYDTMDVRLVDAERGQLVAIYARDADDEQEIFDFAIPIDEGISGWVVRNNEAQLVNDMAQRPARGLHPGHGVGGAAGVHPRPALVGDEVIGIMTMDRLGGRTFEDRELEPARLFANLAAIAIRNARQYDELETTSAPGSRASWTCSTS